MRLGGNGELKQYRMIASDGHELEAAESRRGIEISISFAGIKGDVFDSSALVKEGSGPDVRSEKIGELVLDTIRDLLLSGSVPDRSRISIIVPDVNSSEAIELVRYLEDRGIEVHVPGSVVFFEREEVMLLIGCMIRLFPDYDIELSDCDDCLKSYYGTCIDFADEAMRGAFGVPLRKFIEKFSKVHHRLYMATEYSFSGLFYRLLEFEPFTSWMNRGDCREVRDMAVFSRILCAFEDDRRILSLEPESYDGHVRELLDVLVPELYRKGTAGYGTGYEGIMKGSVGMYGIGRTVSFEEKVPDAVYSIFGDIDLYGSCQKKYWLRSVMGFRPSRSGGLLREELVIRSIRTINEIADDSGSFPVSKDIISDLLSYVMKDFGISESYAEKAETFAARQLMKYLKGQGLDSAVLEHDSTERLESDKFSASGSFTLIEDPMGELEALAVFPGKLPGADEVNRKAELLQAIASLHEERIGDWISRLNLFFAGEDRKDPYAAFDSDEELELCGLKGIEKAVYGIKDGEFSALSSDREVCLACDFRFHCRRTDMRKVKKG